MNKTEEIKNEDTECRLGLCFRPQWAQCLASPKVLVACYGFLNIVDGMLFMYYVGIMTTVEAHFQVKSEVLGMIMSIGELVPILTAMIFGYLCGMGDRPRWISFCALLTSTGCFIATLPFFIFGAPNEDDIFTSTNDNQKYAAVHLCTLTNDTPIVERTEFTNETNEEHCYVNSAHEYSTVVIILYLTGYTLFNCGAVILYVVGTPYMDDNVTQKNSPVYMAILCSLRTIGPMFGFLLSFSSLKFNVNPFQSNIDPDDPRWLGAWWLGYIVMASLAAIGAFLIAQFPIRLPSSHITPAMKMESHKTTSDTKTSTESEINLTLGEKITKSTKDFYHALKPLFKNQLVMLRLVSEVFTWFALESYTLYLPKYMEHQFNVPASDASALSGFALIAPIVLGDLAVGFYIQRYNPKPRKLALTLVVTKLLYTAGMFGLMFIRCDSAYVTGLHDNTESVTCDVDCECPSLPFQPVCIGENRNFLSACHAGCTSFNDSANTHFYENCMCSENANAIPHLCPGICPKFTQYMFLTTITQFFISVEVVAGLIFFFRCVSIEMKTLALGLASVCLSTFTFVPCPIIIAAIIDTTCALWAVSCGENGACLLYDIDKFRYLLHGFPFALLVIACVWDFLFYTKADQLDLYGEEEEIELQNLDNTKL